MILIVIYVTPDSYPLIFQTYFFLLLIGKTKLFIWNNLLSSKTDFSFFLLLFQQFLNYKTIKQTQITTKTSKSYYCKYNIRSQKELDTLKVFTIMKF